MSDDQNINNANQVSQRTDISSVDENERLKFAKQVLLGLFVISALVLSGYACFPDNPALADMFEWIKNNMSQLVAMVLCFYFSANGRK